MEGLAMENLGVVKWSIWLLGFFPVFGMFNQEKSGSPVSNAEAGINFFV
jgi:hypothetical protein